MIDYSIGCRFYPVAPDQQEIRAGVAVSFNDRGQLVRAIPESEGVGLLPESAEFRGDGTVAMSIDDYERMLLQMSPPGRRQP